MIDANGHNQALTYTMNNDAQLLTDGISQITTLAYDTNNNLTSIQAPASAPGQTAAMSSAVYGAPGQTFLPSAVSDPLGNCSAVTYDTAGNIANVYDGQASPCSGMTGGAHYSNAYQGDGTTTCGAKTGELCTSTAITDNSSTLSPLTYADAGQTERTAAGSTTLSNSSNGVQISTNTNGTSYYTRDDKGNIIGERLFNGLHWYFLDDGLGSIVGVTGATGVATGDRYHYDPFGQTTLNTGVVDNVWGFAGGYLDSTGLYKFGARYYDPSVGRWTQQDPIGGSIANPATVNRYVYVNGDPVNATDPSGRSFISCGGSILDIVGGSVLGVFGGLFGIISGATGFTLFLAYAGVVAGYTSISFGAAAIASGSCR